MLIRVVIFSLLVFALGCRSYAVGPDGGVPKEILEMAEPSVGDAILEHAGSYGIVIDGIKHPFEFSGFEMIENEEGEMIPAMIGVFDNESGVVLMPVDMEEEELAGMVILVLDDVPYFDHSPELIELDAEGHEAFGVHGSVVSESGDKAISYYVALSIGAGSSSFRLDGEKAYLNGDLGSGTYLQVEYLIKNHPEVKTIVFEQVPGSVNDEVNVQTGRLIRNAGFTTVLLSDSEIASGGVDLFMAGERRVVAYGGRIGVHSWGDPGTDIKAAELPRDHEMHKHQIEYFSLMMPKGVEFYFYTLEAAEFDNIHWMSEEEIKEWGIATE